MKKNWAYEISINGVGTISYGRDYFVRAGIVNPLTAAPYTKDEIADIVDSAAEGVKGYTFDLPENAVLGMNAFWYDAENAAAITAHADPLTQGKDGVFSAADGMKVAAPIAE